jgi:hypothetical protein
MRGERALLRIGEYMVGRACRRLPSEIRDGRYREWAAELPAILQDPEIRLAPHRAVRMLLYAADTLRGTALTPGRARSRPALSPNPLLGLLIIAGLVAVVATIWRTTRAPGHGANYALLAWTLSVVAWPISEYVRATARMTGLIFISSCLAGVVVFSWNAAQAPGDWVNYFGAGWQFLLLVACWLVRRWARARGHNAGAVAGVIASLSGGLTLLRSWSTYKIVPASGGSRRVSAESRFSCPLTDGPDPD